MHAYPLPYTINDLFRSHANGYTLQNKFHFRYYCIVRLYVMSHFQKSYIYDIIKSARDSLTTTHYDVLMSTDKAFAVEVPRERKWIAKPYKYFGTIRVIA